MKSYNSLLAVLKAFPNEEKCVQHLEKLRWPNGATVCPFCGSSRKFYKVTRAFKNKCADCSKEFSVRKGSNEDHRPFTDQNIFAVFESW